MRIAAGGDFGFAREEAGDGVDICAVKVGAMTFGVPLMRILEILGAPATQPVPLAPPFIGGLVHYRGEVLTAVSLRRLLDMEPYEGTPDLLVLEGSSGCFGLQVDAVCEVLTVQSEAFEPNPSTLDDRLKALFAGTCELKDALMVMLAPERLDPMRLLGD